MTTQENNLVEAAPAKRVAVYTRVACHSLHSAASLDAQRTLCDEAARARGWEVVTHYTDAGWSGHAIERPALGCLLAQASLGRFDIVLVSQLDRMSRNIVVLLDVVERLQGAKVALFTRTELGTVVDVGVYFDRLMAGGLEETHAAESEWALEQEGL